MIVVVEVVNLRTMMMISKNIEWVDDNSCGGSESENNDDDFKG
jgi:hypothetical protein